MVNDDVKTIVGDVVLKFSFVDYAFNMVCKLIPDCSNTLQTKIETLKNLRKKFAHEIIIVNQSNHPNDFFLSKIIESNWIIRKDGERIQGLYSDFVMLYESVVNDLKKMVEKTDNKTVSDKTQDIVFLMGNTSVGTAVARSFYLSKDESGGDGRS